jgi:hypothetical protein
MLRRYCAIFALGGALTLAACVPDPPNIALGTDCDPDRFAGLIGQSGEIARLLVLDQPMRVIAPGTAVTMDYVMQRINFELDAADRITAVRCG